MEKSLIENEISMTKFLNRFLGVNPNIAKNITHDDVKILFSNLESFTDYEFWNKNMQFDIIDFVRVKDKNKKVKYYRKPIINIKEEIQELEKIEECSLTFFLENYLGEKTTFLNLFTHDDALDYYSQIIYLTEEEFENLDNPLKNKNYIKVIDVDNNILYYDKLSIYNHKNDECSENIILKYKKINLDDKEKWELIELKKKLKLIKKNNRRVLNQQITDVSKQLTKRKKAKLNDKYKRK